MHTIPCMDYQWNPAKAAANARKHGVDFADAVLALEDEMAVTIIDPDAENEERYISLGMDAVGRILVTVFTIRDKAIRIISFRKASKTERKLYEKPL
ncbi:MAG: BrnT family toxin [Gammaproteobacteria bacterium]